MKTRRQNHAATTENIKKEERDSDSDDGQGNSSESEQDTSFVYDGGLTEYEKQRLENIKKNMEAMRMLHLPEAIAAVSSTKTERTKRSAPTPGLRKEKRIKKSEVLPRRTSSRLRKSDNPNETNDDANLLKLEDIVETTTTVYRRERKSGILSLSDTNGHGDESKFAKLMEEMATYVPENARVKDAEDESDNEEDTSAVKNEQVDEVVVKEEADEKLKKEEEDDKPRMGIMKYFLPSRRAAAAAATTTTTTTANDKDTEATTTKTTSKARTDKDKASHPTSSKSSKDPSLRRQVQSLSIRGPWPIVKVCQKRIYCMAFHENRDKLLVCGGDIDGNLGFWDLDESQADDYEPDLEEEPNVYSYSAHTCTLSSMQYSPTDPTKLFTTSYDGSVRYLDLVKQQFLESYVVAPDVSDHLGSISIDSQGQQLFFADNDGAVTLKDIRTPKDQMVFRKTLHEKKVGCVNVNPKYGHLIVTSSLDRTMKLWDIRTFGQYKEEPIPELAEYPHRLSVTSAMWSPDGKSIASTSYDDNVRIFNNFEPGLPDIKEIPEPVRIPHNNQSGRWVTMLRAVWSHQFNWFSIGNMNSKSVDIYSRGTGDLMANLRDAKVFNTVPAVNTWHPNRLVIASGMANGKMVIWR